jgi:hypothetical protein
MVVKKIFISYLLLGLISMQVIPIKALREFITKDNISHEFVNDFENEEDGEKKNDAIKNITELFHQDRFNSDFHPSENKNKYNIKNIRFNSRISDDIPTRPPLSLC